MKKLHFLLAAFAVVLGLCVASSAFAATVVSSTYYENMLKKLAPQDEGITFTEEELAQYETITVGDSGEAVLQLKNRMYELGYFKNQTDNETFTSTTAEYVKTFQELNGLEATGVATPEMQALFYSDYAVVGPNADGYVEDLPDLEITYGKVIQVDTYGSGIQLNIQNNTEYTIDTYYVVVCPLTDEGELADAAENLDDELLLSYCVEEYDLEPNSKLYSIDCRIAFIISEDTYYSNVIATVVAYETSDGEYVNMYSPETVWYGCGSAVTSGSFTEEGNTAVAYPTEEELAVAESWSFGIYYIYIPAVFRDYYDVPEGIYIYGIDLNSAATDAGLQEGDILIAVGAVLTNCEASLNTAMGRIEEGESAEVLYWRDGVFYLTTVSR